ncbi:SCO family protein [Thiothrix lacustris]|uniref:SCO family protein n=1 Tax=Thiothrix lacustris TaxID=525917 RepID=UPI0027E5A019|nr:SCO family protein [Thiothrix lacustris]WMP19437.1 SCO family protein [Thiothrix lacustris]
MKISTLLIAVLTFVLGLLAAKFLFESPSASAPNSRIAQLLQSQADVIKTEATKSDFSGPVIEGGIGDNFTLSQGHKQVSLSDFRGKAVVIYFGYTSCPDVCPTTLGIISGGLKSLTPEEIAQVQPIFISLDPERDKRDNGTPLMTYAQHFHPSFIGLTGASEEIRKVATRYRTFFSTIETTSYLGYLIHHTSKTYVISKDGKSVQVLPHDMSKEDLAKAIRKAL